VTDYPVAPLVEMLDAVAATTVPRPTSQIAAWNLLAGPLSDPSIVARLPGAGPLVEIARAVKALHAVGLTNPHPAIHDLMHAFVASPAGLLAVIEQTEDET
jgi:hypothetical protein